MQLSIGYGRSGSVSCRLEEVEQYPFAFAYCRNTKSFHSIILFLSKNTAECRTLLDMIEGNREAIL